MMMDKNWNYVPKVNQDKVNHLSKALGLDKTLCQILVQRGIESFEEARQFFRPNLANLHDPYLMKDMQVAVDRVQKAFENQENILIYGDYDVDGTTAVSLVFSYLTSFYPHVATYIPDRYEEGYGVSFQGIDFAHDNDISLIIALDCGIKAIDKVEYANSKGIDFIICDHHRPGDKIPDACAILNPKRIDCEYPYKELCGCGVGFKLVQAIAKTRGQSMSDLMVYLDLVVTAIAADIVPITGENRILASFGLKEISNNPRPGIKALMGGLKKDKLTITDVVFGIAPKINAAGRMKHGSHAIELLTETNFEKAKQYANAIDQLNSSRKDLDKKITEEALIQIKNNDEINCKSSVVYDENWHKGVIGIVASRLIEKHYRPTLVFTKSGDKLAASARSVKGFDVYEALCKCEEYIEQFGGHKYAAGLTLKPENYQLFKEKFEEVVSASITIEQLIPEVRIDAEINLSEITPKFHRVLKQFGPFGPSNMNPVFASFGLHDNGYGKKVGSEGDHLKLSIINGSDQKTYNAIGFGLGGKYDLIDKGHPFNAAFTIEENIWNGIVSMQLNLKDLKIE